MLVTNGNTNNDKKSEWSFMMMYASSRFSFSNQLMINL